MESLARTIWANLGSLLALRREWPIAQSITPLFYRIHDECRGTDRGNLVTTPFVDSHQLGWA